jgi:hypothetical protein
VFLVSVPPSQAFAASVCKVNAGTYVDKCYSAGHYPVVSVSCDPGKAQPTIVTTTTPNPPGPNDGYWPCMTNVTVSCAPVVGNKTCNVLGLPFPTEAFADAIPNCPADCTQDNSCPKRASGIYGACQYANSRKFYTIGYGERTMPHCEDNPFAGTFGQPGRYCLNDCVIEVHPEGAICCGPVQCYKNWSGVNNCIDYFSSVSQIPVDFTRRGLCSSCVTYVQSHPGQKCTPDDAPVTGAPPTIDAGNTPVGWQRASDGTLVPGVPPGYSAQPSTGYPGDAGTYPLDPKNPGQSGTPTKDTVNANTGTAGGSGGSSSGSGGGSSSGSGGSGLGGGGNADDGSSAGGGDCDPATDPSCVSGDGKYARPTYTPDKRMDNSNFPTDETFGGLSNIKNPIPNPGGRCSPHWDIKVVGFTLPIDFSASIWSDFASLLRNAFSVVMWFGFFTSYLVLFNWWVKSNDK